MREFTVRKKMTNSTLILCRCGKEHNVNNKKLSSFVCKENILTELTNNEVEYWKQYKKGAEKRNLEFNLSTLEFKHLVNSKCFYCGQDSEYKTTVGAYLSGIDRMDSSKGYTADNCVSSCSTCNKLKGSLHHAEFLGHINKMSKRVSLLEKLKNEDRDKVVAEMFKSGTLTPTVTILSLLKKGYLKLSDISFDLLKNISNNNLNNSIKTYNTATDKFGIMNNKEMFLIEAKDLIDSLKKESKLTFQEVIKNKETGELEIVNVDIADLPKQKKHTRKSGFKFLDINGNLIKKIK